MTTENADDSYLGSNGERVHSFVGPDATRLFQAMTLRSAIQLHARSGIIPTRGVGITKMLALATKFSGKPYKRTEADQAAADLGAWIEAMRSALPVVRT